MSSLEPQRVPPARPISPADPVARARLVTESRNLTLDAFRAFADPVRLELLALIAARGPVCVCHLQEVLPYAQPRISKHLAVLRRAGLVTAERRGSWAFYSIDREAFTAARDFLDDVDASLRRPHLADSCADPGASD